MEGYNATIFAYGQSVRLTQGSGKTFTMLGPEEVTTALVNDQEVTSPSLQDKSGLIPRAISQVFSHIRECIKEFSEFAIKCSYIEIYNEAVNDLLGDAKNLRVREFPRLGMCVIGMTERCVTGPAEVLDALAAGTKRRITCATGQNARSSRSHSIFCVSVDQKLLNGSTKSSKLNLIDLAGSEKVGKSQASGQQLKEAQSINLSLTTLGRCIKALAGGKGEHVPFRESKLTMILRESLGGNAKTTLLCTASQRTFHVEESLGTLKFAERAKKVTLRATSNVRQSPEELALVIEQLKAEVSLLRQQLQGQSGCSLAIEDYTDLSIRFAELKSQYANLSESAEIEIERLRQREEQTVDQENALIAQVEGAESRVAELQEENEAMKQRFEQEKTNNEDLRREAEALRQDYSRLSEAWEQAIERVEAGEAEKSRLRELSAGLETALNEANDRLAASHQQVTLEQAAKDRIARENLQLSTALAAAQQALQDSELQLEAVKARFQAQSAQLLAAELAKQQAESSVAALSVHFRMLESNEGAVCEVSQSRGSNTKAGKTRAVISKLLQELTDLKAEIDAAGLQHQNELLAVKQASEDKQFLLENLLQSTQTALEEERGRGKSLQTALQEMSVELETANFSLKQTKLQLSTTKSTLQTEITAHKSLEEAFNRLDSSLEKAPTQSLTEIQLLQEEKAAMEEALLEREAELTDLDSLVKGLESQLSAEQERNRQLDRALAQATPTLKGTDFSSRRMRKHHTMKDSVGEMGGFSLQDVQSIYSICEEEEAGVKLGSLQEVDLSEENEHCDGQRRLS